MSARVSTDVSTDKPPTYVSGLTALVRLSLTSLLHPPSHARRAVAARRLARQAVLLAAALGAAIIVLMYALDATEIGLMPPRGAPGLWPVRILTDFGKAANVLWLLAAALLAITIMALAMRGI